MAIKKFDGVLAKSVEVGQWVLMDSRFPPVPLMEPVEVERITAGSFFFRRDGDTIPSHRLNTRIQLVADTKEEAFDAYEKICAMGKSHRLELDHLVKLHRVNMKELVGKLCQA